MKSVKSLLVFMLFLILLSAFSLHSEISPNPLEATAQPGVASVLNQNTGKRYVTIQDAVDAPETVSGHQIFVSSGTYHEHVTVNKSLSIIGEDRGTTIINGEGKGTVVYVTADQVEIRNFTVQNGTYGLWLLKSEGSKIVYNTVKNCSYGIRLFQSPHTEAAGNNVFDCKSFSFVLDASGNCTLRGNSVYDNVYNFGVDGNLLSDFVNDIDDSNTVNGKPIHYLINRHNVAIDSSTFSELGYLAVINSTNVDVENLVVEGNVQGVHLAFSSNCTIEGVNARSNWNGICVSYSQNVSVVKNEAHGNFDYGLKLVHCSNSLVKGNDMDDNGWSGIGFIQSHNCTIDGNRASYNFYDLHVVYSNNSVIMRNTAVHEPTGYSIAVFYSHNNLIYHNTFDNSLLYVEARDHGLFVPPNSWDNGYEGNYWRYYAGFDGDEDGIGDSAYELSQNNVDNYPLKGMYSDFAAVLEGETYVIEVISNSSISEFSFDSQESKMRFWVGGENGTSGFCRLAVPNALIESLSDGDLNFTINGEESVLKKQWSSELYSYWYFSYVHSVPESTIDAFFVFVIAVLVVGVCVSVFSVIWRRKH